MPTALAPKSGLMAGHAAAFRVGGARTSGPRGSVSKCLGVQDAPAQRSSGRSVRACGIRDGQKLDGRKLRVAVVGGGPSGACTADELAKGGVETYMIERKMDNCKV